MHPTTSTKLTIRLMLHTTPQVDEAINSAMLECVLDQRQFEI